MAPIASRLSELLSSQHLRDKTSQYIQQTAPLWNSLKSTVASSSSALTKRAGYVPPNDFSKGVIVIFSLLGAALGLLVWWFFQKQGGFQWKEDDWDDYKSTVLRRKDANGKTISSGSTRAPETVVTEMTYQDTYYDEARTEKDSRMSDDEGGKKKKSKKFGRWKKNKNRNFSPTSTERNNDHDLESYASEEPARMKSYNPYPSVAPSDISPSESASQVGSNQYPSRYSYGFSRVDEPTRPTTDSSDKSLPLGPRRPTRKGTSKSPRKPSKRVAAPPTDLSTIPDDESRLSFEMQDDAAFTAYSSVSPSKSTRRGPPPPVGGRNPTQRKPSRRVSRRDRSHGTYASAGTNSESECDSDCSCCTTATESEDEDDMPQGDRGTKIYHHPLSQALAPKPPPAVVVKKNSRSGPATKRSYRNDSVGTLSSVGSEGEGSIIAETVASKVKRALQMH